MSIDDDFPPEFNKEALAFTAEVIQFSTRLGPRPESTAQLYGAAKAYLELAAGAYLTASDVPVTGKRLITVSVAGSAAMSQAVERIMQDGSE